MSPEYTLQSPVADRSNATPFLLDFDGNIGLLWGTGTFGGTIQGGRWMLDDSLSFVVLDGDSLGTRSGVVTLVNPETTGGLTHPLAVKRGQDLLVVSTIQYHVGGEAVSAAIRCAR